MKKRNQIPEKYKWNLKDIYEDDKYLLEDIEKLKTYESILGAYKGKLKKVKLCLEYFLQCTECSKLGEKIGVYLGLRLAEDLENTKYLELQSVVSNISKKIGVATAFEEAELLKCGAKYINKLINDERFVNYRLELMDFLRTKDHVLLENEEVLMNKASKVLGGYSDVFDNIDTLDIKFADAKDSKGKMHEVNDHNYAELLESNDRVLRSNAMDSFNKGYHSLCNTIATNYINSVEGDWFVADVYKHKSTLDMAMFGENLPKQIYTNLLDNVNKNLKNVHKFYALKKKALGYKDFYFYDRLVSITKFKGSLDYEEGMDTVIEAMRVMGDEYVEGLKRARAERWIDVYPCEKKQGGGFCCSMYAPHPYILLNTVEDSRGVYTLAHELGHAMHGYLSAKNQPYETYDHTIFLAEIASTVNEVLLFKYLYNNSRNKGEKLAHLEKYISNIIATIYTQSLYSEFEYFAHELVEKGEPISKEILNKKYKELTQKYYGKGVKLSKTDIGEGWMRIPHFYRAFYVYKYATGMTSAINFATKIYAGDLSAKEKYLKYLKSGTEDYSINILKNAGVDLLSNEPYKVMNKELVWALKEMELLIQK